VSAALAGTALTISGAARGAGAAGDAPAIEHRPVAVRGTAARVAAFVKDGRVRRLYGEAFAHGATAPASAESFLDANADLIGARRADLAAAARHLVPVSFDRTRGSFTFTAVVYGQERDGVPVHGTRLVLLTRNEPGQPLVLVSADVRDLGDFRVDGADRAAPLAPAGAAAATDRALAMSPLAGPAQIVATHKAIWAGSADAPAAPRLADVTTVAVDADKWLVVTDARTGAILHDEQLICMRGIDVTGNVSGRATEGIGAEQCEEEVAMPLPHLRVTAGSAQGHTDADGDYVLSGFLGFPVDVTATLSGLWFDVFNIQGAESVLTQSVTPPAVVNFLFNATNTSEQVRAETNGYVFANAIRDFVLRYNPAFPTLDQGGFPVNVNRTDGFCPGNAWYDPEDVTINFCLSSSTRPNTAWSSVIYHEYGHHMVAAAGSGQGPFGEGFGDVMSVVILDDPNVGFGFFDDCVSTLRTADNDCQYDPFGCSTCGSESHACGNLLSGCAWSTRNALVVTEPADYRDILASLAVNSVLLHSGSSIDPSVTIDWLTVDDDNATIFDGTPHYAEIAAGFGAHGLDAPELALLLFEFPDGLPEFVSPAGTTTVRVEVSGVQGVPQPGTGEMFYDDGGGAVPIAMTPVSPNVYDAEFPAAACGTSITYYFAAETTGGLTQLWPPDAPAERFAALTATGSVMVLSDDFQTDEGWTTENIDLTDGQWDRGVPAGGGDRGDPAADFDGSGACWLTDNEDGNSDIDGGPTRLISYTLDLSATAEPVIGYARWFTNDDLDVDRLDVHVSSNGGVGWVLVESVGDQDGVWVESSFRVADYVTPTANVRVRFSATDNPNDSVSEAAIDALRVVSLLCDEPCPADIDGDGSVTFEDLLSVLAAWGPCPSCPEDLDDDGTVGFTDLLTILASWGPCV
jgi:hypothetical protein